MVYKKSMLGGTHTFSEDVHKYLCCPKCKQEFQVGEKLCCSSCGTQYDMREEIPILVDLESLPDHLSHQIKYFENESISNTPYYLDAWQESYVERFKTNFSDVKGKVIIDCGTGSGYMAIELAKQGAFVIACDLTLKSLVRLRVAAQQAGVARNMLTVCCSAEKLPFKSSIADYFISNAVLEHLPNEKDAIEEINRTCKDQAGVMVAVPLSYKKLFPPLLPFNIIHDKRIGHLRRYDKEILNTKFSHWSVLNTYYTGHVLKVTKIIINIIYPIFNLQVIEKKDRGLEKKSLWASNIIIFFVRNV